MRNISLSVAAFLLSGSAFAELATIRCERATNVGRPDSVAGIIYKYATSSDAGALACAAQLTGGFCRSIQMNQSRYLGATRLDECQRPRDQYRQALSFHLVQEDEFDNLVTVVITRSCETGAIGRRASAVIANSSGREVPSSADAVACSVTVDP